MLGCVLERITWGTITEPPGDQGTQGWERQVLLGQTHPILPQGDSRDEGEAGDVYVDLSQAFVAVYSNIVMDEVLAQGLGECSVNWVKNRLSSQAGTVVGN